MTMYGIKRISILLFSISICMYLIGCGFYRFLLIKKINAIQLGLIQYNFSGFSLWKTTIFLCQKLKKYYKKQLTRQPKNVAQALNINTFKEAL